MKKKKKKKNSQRIKKLQKKKKKVELHKFDNTRLKEELASLKKDYF